MDSDIASRAVNALIAGLIAGVITAVVVWLLSALLPGVVLDPGFWGMVVGVIVGLVTFLGGNRNRTVL